MHDAVVAHPMKIRKKCQESVQGDRGFSFRSSSLKKKKNRKLEKIQNNRISLHVTFGDFHVFTDLLDIITFV